MTPGQKARLVACATSRVVKAPLSLGSAFFWTRLFLRRVGLRLRSGSSLLMRLGLSMRRILGSSRCLWTRRALRTRCGFLRRGLRMRRVFGPSRCDGTWCTLGARRCFLRRGLCMLCILGFWRSRLCSLWRRRTFMLRRVPCRTSRTGLLRSARWTRHIIARCCGAFLRSARPGGAVRCMRSRRLGCRLSCGALVCRLIRRSCLLGRYSGVVAKCSRLGSSCDGRLALVY